MKIYAFLDLFTILCTFSIGLLVYFKTPRSRLTFIFLLFTLSLGFFSLAQYQLRIASNFQEAWLWSKMYAIWPLVTILLLHFILELNNKAKDTFLFYSILYVPLLIISFVEFSSDLITLAPVEKYWGWSIQFNYSNWYILTVILVLIYWSLTWYFSFYFYVNSTGKIKKQALFIFIGSTLSFLSGTITDIIFPILKIEFPELAASSITIPLFFFAYGIWRYNLFTLNTDSLSQKLFTSISNYLLLVDGDKKILEINRNLLGRLQYAHEDLIGKKLDFLIKTNTQNENPINTHLIHSTEFKNKEMVFNTRWGESLPLVFSASFINQKGQSKQGLLYIGNEEKLNNDSQILINENKKQIEFLAEAALDLVKFNTNDKVYNYMTDKLYNLLDKKAIVLCTEFKWANENFWKIKSLKGISHKHTEISKLLGFDINNMSGSTEQKQFSLIEVGKLLPMELNFEGLTNGIISNQLGEKAINLLGIKDLYTIFMQHGNQLFGTTSILLNNTTPPLNNELIESFMSIASMVLNRQYAEAELTKSEKLFRTIVEDSEITIFIVDLEGKFLLSEGKPLKKLGLKPGEVVGMSVYDVYKDNPTVIKSIEHALSGEAFNELLQIKEDLYFNVRYTPYRNEKGEIIGSIGMADDVSERIESESRLAELSEMQSKLFKVIGHDLKSPLANILSYADLILSDFDSFENEEIQHFIQNIQKAGQNGYQILDDLLQWSKSIQSKTPIVLEKSNLRSKVLISIKQVQAFANKKNIQITNTLKDSTQIIADQNMVITVLRNILSNAIKFTNAYGHIEIHCKEDESHVYLSISDNGIGMTENQITTLFNDDIKKPSRGTEGETGSGLGLKICKDFVEKNGGEITVQSQLKEGSIFTVSFPKVIDKYQKKT